MISRALLTIALLLLLSAPAAASPRTPVDPLAVANAAWPDSPCAGKLRMLVDRAVGTRDRFAEATGIAMWSDGAWERVSCDVTVDPRFWGSSSTEQKCLVLVHEAGHLAGHIDHTPTGVMASLPTTGSWPACLSLRARIITALEADGGTAYCSRWQGRVLPCRVDTPTRARSAWYRVRTRGDAFAITRSRRG